jgi:hypothetical protein
VDVTQALKDVENALRDFIAHTLEKVFGAEWEKQCGVSPERLKQWHERQEVERKRQETGVVEERLLYYADFYDLGTILHKHWGQHFSVVFGKWKTMEIFLEELGKLRDPNAHQRELLPHQKHLVLGLSGEIRTRITRFKSSQETGESYFPRIESVCDSLGNIWTYNSPSSPIKGIRTQNSVFPGDTIDFVVTASDPLDEPLLYTCTMKVYPFEDKKWSENNELSITFSQDCVGLGRYIYCFIKSQRKFHAYGTSYDFYDDSVEFVYDVLPPPTEKGRNDK